jgi:DNA-binding response OmpR family regulator
MNDQPIHVLLVEDNLADVLLLQEALAEVSLARFELSHVDRLAKALEWLSREPFEVVLLDLGLPDSQGGLATLVKLREQAPVVVLTGLTDERFGLSALQAGAQDYLVKGQVEGHQLARAIRYAIERKRTETEIHRRNRELVLLNQVIAASAAGLEPEAVLDIACRELVQTFDLPQATAGLFNEDKTDQATPTIPLPITRICSQDCIFC